MSCQVESLLPLGAEARGKPELRSSQRARKAEGTSTPKVALTQVRATPRECDRVEACV